MPPSHQPKNAKISQPNPVPYTFILSPVGIGRKEKREQWVWKDEVKGSKKPQPIAYDCVISGGPVPTITIRRPIDPTKSVPAQRQLSDRTNPPVLERYPSPVIPVYHPQCLPSSSSTTANWKQESSTLSIEYQRPSPAIPVYHPQCPPSSRSTTANSKQESSKLSIEYQRPSPAIPVCHPQCPPSSRSTTANSKQESSKLSIEYQRPSPAIPVYHPQYPSSSSSTTANSKQESSTLSIEYQRPNFEKIERKPLPSLSRIKSGSLESDTFESVIERSFMDGSESSETVLSPRTFIEAPQRGMRRSYVINPVNATPRTMRTPQIAPQFFEVAEDITSPMGLLEGEPLQSPWTLSLESGHVTRTAPSSLCDTLFSPQASKFAEYTDNTDGEIMPWKKSASVVDIPPTAPPIPEKSNLRLSTAVEMSFDEWKESKRVWSPSQGQIRLPPPADGTSTVSLPATSLPTSPATVRTTASAQARLSTLADIMGPAEAKPVMICAVVPSGTARLVGS